MKTWYGLAVQWVINIALIYWAYTIGLHEGINEGVQKERGANECYCGATQSCVFGPGIPGTQSCETRLIKNKWSRCEPVKP